MGATTLPKSRNVAVRVPLLALVAGAVLLGLLFHEECAAAVRVWIESTAYGHCFLIAPMAAYLAWERRDRLRGAVPRPWPAAALLALPITLVWIVAERLGIMEGRQLAAVAALETLALAVLGLRLCRLLAAPLLYLVFLVPFGAFLTPFLQRFTADFVAVGLKVLGVPSLVTDMTIEIPEGAFYVAEACAGLRFLIAAVAFGVFFALLTYRSPGRRLAFIAASCVIPVVANGFRALGIVMLGHVLGSAEAAETDHILYGWMFFSIVLLLLIAAGLPFRESASSVPPAAVRRAGRLPRGGAARAWDAAAVAVALSAAGPAAAALLDRYPGEAQLARGPRFVPGPGCTAGPADADGPARYVARYTCAGLPVVTTVQALPPGVTPDRLAEVERQLAGDGDAEDTERSVLTLSHGAPREWRLVETSGPTRFTAMATWIDGHPMGGGMRARFRQAWASLRASFGAAGAAPVIAAVQIAGGPERLGTDAQARMRAQLAQFLDAQPDLPGDEASP